MEGDVEALESPACARRSIESHVLHGLSPSSRVDIYQLAHQLLEHGLHTMARPALTFSGFQLRISLRRSPERACFQPIRASVAGRGSNRWQDFSLQKLRATSATPPRSASRHGRHNPRTTGALFTATATNARWELCSLAAAYISASSSVSAAKHRSTKEAPV